MVFLNEVNNILSILSYALHNTMRLKIPPGVQVLFFGGAMWVISKYAKIVSFDFTGIYEFAFFFLSSGILMIGIGIAEFR